MQKYRLWCNTDEKEEFVVSSSVPTECPTNAGHSIDTSSIAIIETNPMVNDGTAKNLTLADYKQLRYNEIDIKTQALISTGFTYDSMTFSLSITSQMNWSSIKENTPDFTFPLAISTKNNYEYSLAEANVTAFWTAGRDAVKGHLDSGRDLKKSVYDAADEAAVDAVVDTR
jgi:hypothetical protein